MRRDRHAGRRFGGVWSALCCRVEHASEAANYWGLREDAVLVCAHERENNVTAAMGLHRTGTGR
jgi:hypothetical protein